MKAFAIDGFDEEGTVREVAEQQPEPGQLRVKVAAAGLNPYDISVLQGRMEGRMEHRFPLIPGMDASGTVESAGEGVTAFSVGDDVFGSVGKAYLGEGTLAESVTMSAETIARKPASVDHDLAASIPVAGVTALLMANDLQIQPDETVLANGATGGVGSYFVQFASARGAQVIAVCSGANADYARSLGAAEVVDYNAGDVAAQVRSAHPGGIDAIADMHAVEGLMIGLSDSVREGGRVVSAVGSADVDSLAARAIWAKNMFGAVNTERLEIILGMFERKEIRSPELQTFSLDRAPEAVALLATGHVRGKIVVVAS